MINNGHILVSVIIPTYKPQSYLWECLDSIIAQTLPKDKFELILVLNGCNEPYRTEIERYISINMKDHYVTFIQTSEGGVSFARNLALDVVKGDYVTFIDDDDFVSPNYLKELYEKASMDTISLSYPYAFIDGDLTQVDNYVTRAYDKCFKKCKINYTRARSYFSGPCMKLIPMSYIQNNRYDVRFRNGEDSLFMFLISNKFKYVDFTSTNAVYYRRIRENSAVNNNRSKLQNAKSCLLQVVTYIKYFLAFPLEYNWFFFMTRVGGTLYSALTYRPKKSR